jgi:hypothetical protein
LKIMDCAEKLHHKTEREALNHLRWAKKQPGGHGIKHLGVYSCPCGHGWCVGRAWRSKREKLAAQPKLAPEPKPLTAGQLRRKAKREAVHAERCLHYRLRQVDALGSLADLADSFGIALRMAAAEIALKEKQARIMRSLTQ